MKKDKKYDTNKMRHTGWNNPGGNDLTGYSAWAYFGDEGEYLGPDSDGVEPTFDIEED